MFATTTLNRIMEPAFCITGIDELLHSLGKTEPDDEPLFLLYILETIGLDDAILALNTIEEQPEVRLFAVRCARQVQHQMSDPHNRTALDVAEMYAVGDVSDEEANAALEDAKDATLSDPSDINRRYTLAALYAIQGDAYNTAWIVAKRVAEDAEDDESWAAAWSEVWAEQERDFRAIFCTEDVNRQSLQKNLIDEHSELKIL